MLEYFTYKKVKKLNAEKRARKEAQKSGLEPVLSGEDERFIERIVADGTPPALPERPTTANQSMSDVDRSISPLGISTGKEKNKENEKEPGKVRKKANRISLLFAKSKKDDIDAKDNEREDDDITRVLNDLNMSAVNNRALSLSKESNELIQKFTLVLKDLVNGVPTAYDDLTHLLDDSQGTLAKTYDHLPSFLKKLIATLPQKWTSTLAPELLATASEAHTLGGEGAAAAAGGGLMGAAKGFLKPNGLKDLVTKPGAVAALLRTIMNSLKVRFPAFMGTNVLLSLSLFVLLFVLWYCHKRGREVRLAAESKAEVVDSEGRVTKVKDDHLLEFSASPRDERRRRSHDSGRLRELSSNSSPRRKSRDSRRHNSNSNNNHSPKRDSHNSHGIDDSIASSSPRRRHERSRSPGRRHHER